jgi:hypothetical protein
MCSVSFNLPNFPLRRAVHPTVQKGKLRQGSLSDLQSLRAVLRESTLSQSRVCESGMVCGLMLICDGAVTEAGAVHSQL